MKNSKLKSIGNLISKAYMKWTKEYHYVIPLPVLKMYVHKFMHESDNIRKHGVSFFETDVVEEYSSWLKLQTYKPDSAPFSDITVIGKKIKKEHYPSFTVKEMQLLDIHKISTNYVLVTNGGIVLYPEFTRYVSECEGYDLTYFDHDHLVHGVRKDPVLKPDLAYDTLRGINYIGNLFVVRKELLEPFDGMEIDAYAWLLKLTDKPISCNHVEKILYSDAYNSSKEITILKDYLGDDVDIQILSDGIGRKVYYPIVGNPKVSIMIPTKDGKDVLKTCIESIYEKSTYTNFEIIIADNNSEKEETFEYFNFLQNTYSNLKVLKVNSIFNFSLINNRMAEMATGEYFILLNNDTSIITPNWMEKMLSYATQSGVGSVGVKLWYPDDTIQHAGVILGKGGAAAHKYYRCEKNTKGYMYALDIPNNVSCCTAACLMTSRKCWNQLKGMDEKLTVQFNDVDYAIRLMEAGYRNVFLPDVELYHYESKSRGIDKDPKAVERFMSEVNYAKNEWAAYIMHDPFYNDNFDKNYDYKLIVGTGSN